MLILVALTMLAVPMFMHLHLKIGRVGELRPLDIGIVFSWTVTLYGTLPLIGIALASSGIGELYDGRLGGVIPPQETVLSIGLMYLLFSVGFSVCYVVLQNRSTGFAPLFSWIRPTSGDVITAAFLTMSVILSLLFLRIALGIEAADDYLGTYLEVADQSLIVQQVFGIVSQTKLSATILLIVFVLARYPHLHKWVGLVVFLMILQAIIEGGSRSHPFSCALGYLVARSIFDARMSFWTIGIFGIFGLFLFLVAGLLRQTNMSDTQLPALYLLQGGEFMSLFTNAIDLKEKMNGLENQFFGLRLYFVDVMRLLPTQIVGNLKINPSAVYVENFYPDFKDAGGAYAFGAITESVVGFGPAEALLRGGLVGCFFAFVARACLGRNRTVLRAFIYTWFVIVSFNAFRDTSFSLIGRFAFQMLPLLLALHLIGMLRPRRKYRATSSVQHQSKGMFLR